MIPSKVLIMLFRYIMGSEVSDFIICDPIKRLAYIELGCKDLSYKELIVI